MNGKCNNGLNKKVQNYANMPSVRSGLQINEAKRKCQECLHGHCLRSYLFENTMLQIKSFVVIVRSVYNFSVIKIHVVIMLINMLGNL